MPESCDLFEYKSGRWIRVFNVFELTRLAALAIQQKEVDVIGFEKLAEWGFNRTTEPKFLVVASEVATLEFLRAHDIPVPKVLGYSAVANNRTGTEYIFVEHVRGQNLGDIWYTLSERERRELVARIVQLESRSFELQFPASGSLYFCKDLPDNYARVLVPGPESTHPLCIGPDTSLELWHGKRLNLSVERGPYRDPSAVLAAGALKEIAYLEKFGRPLQTFQRLRREIYNYQPQSHLAHTTALEKYLQVAPHLVPHNCPALHRPIIRHPDLQPNNIFVSDNLEITGLIDWQHSTIRPLFLQCGIPESLKNYGDEISKSLQIPTLPSNFDEMEELEQFEQVELLRRRQLHYYYVKMTAERNPEHYEALTYDFNLVTLSKNWTEVNRDAKAACLISFSDDESTECLRLVRAQSEADEQFKACLEAIGARAEGWVPVTHYDEAKTCERKLKADALDAAETEEARARIEENWIFDDFCEEDYM
ncbi:phosphotransferase [Penicillium brasilianum]|uniref:Phosphotransferase n=1 Tax=Penicillium brasilianum TaxID=104259 RepID=A0A1S9RXF2_PENBI|nr:phosphotransferase [Penicillium brasilianum]